MGSLAILLSLATLLTLVWAIFQATWSWIHHPLGSILYPRPCRSKVEDLEKAKPLYKSVTPKAAELLTGLGDEKPDDVGGLLLTSRFRGGLRVNPVTFLRGLVRNIWTVL